MSWAIGQTQTFTVLPYEESGGVPWFILTVLQTGIASFEAAQQAIDTAINVPDWGTIPNLGPGPSLHSQWSPGVVGLAVAQPEKSLVPLLMNPSSIERSEFSGPPPLSGGGVPERPTIIEQATGSGFRLLRPRRPPTA